MGGSKAAYMLAHSRGKGGGCAYGIGKMLGTSRAVVDYDVPLSQDETYLDNRARADIPVGRATKNKPVPLHVDVAKAVRHNEYRRCVSLSLGRFPSSAAAVAPGRSIRSSATATSTTVGSGVGISAPGGDTRWREAGGIGDARSCNAVPKLNLAEEGLGVRSLVSSDIVTGPIGLGNHRVTTGTNDEEIVQYYHDDDMLASRVASLSLCARQ